jgi:2-polyprenyl-3-methyl-5-hydroxy-6-metoxy-1,4-benzoquinol methylase
MKKPDTSIIDQPWPESELEHVDSCPYCGSKERTLAYKDVQDWSFYSAPGKWMYWDCKGCEALYLNPRPKEESIGKAYASYYTHNSNSESLLCLLKTRLRNECFSHWLKTNVTPRLNLPKALSFLLVPFKSLIKIPFELTALADLPKGQILDVGCGNGNKLILAKQLGWDVTGLEIDPNAVMIARNQKLNVKEGSYKDLANFVNEFDCIICSHVLEHVYNPVEMLKLLTQSLKPGGTLLLSLPNSKSRVREMFGANWRGLEAPRHIAIPSQDFLIMKMLPAAFIVNCAKTSGFETVAESIRIQKRLLKLNYLNFKWIRSLPTDQITDMSKSDFISLVCVKKYNM